MRFSLLLLIHAGCVTATYGAPETAANFFTFLKKGCKNFLATCIKISVHIMQYVVTRRSYVAYEGLCASLFSHIYFPWMTIFGNEVTRRPKMVTKSQVLGD